jgi:hypothetical protein
MGEGLGEGDESKNFPDFLSSRWLLSYLSDIEIEYD